MKKTKFNHVDEIISVGGGIISDNETQRYTEKTVLIFKDADLLSNLADKWQNVLPDKAQGHLFEQLEVIKFNYDALKKDSDLYAKTTASMGLPTDPVDIVIKRGNKTVREVQAKSCNSAARSTFALSNKKYKEMQRLAPKDQHDEIDKLLKKRIKTGTLKAEDYEQTLRNHERTLSHEDVSSTGTNYQESLDSTNQEVADEVAREYKYKAALTDMHQSGLEAGKIGAGISSSVTVATEMYAFLNGERELADVAINTAIAGAKGYATGYTVTALSKGVSYASTHFLGETVAKSLTRSNAHVAIASGVINTGKLMVSYLAGDIDFEQLSEQISHTAITSTSAFYYGALGQAAIPIPVVGALVGSGVGYLIGNLIHQSGLLALGDCNVVKVAKERRQQIELMCLQAIPQIQQHRQQLEQQLQQHVELRQQGLDFGFSLMSDALVNYEPDEYLKGLNKIGEQFGVVLPYQNFEEFDQMMSSDEKFSF
jgi:hypothetical protein